MNLQLKWLTLLNYLSLKMYIISLKLWRESDVIKIFYYSLIGIQFLNRELMKSTTIINLITAAGITTTIQYIYNEKCFYPWEKSPDVNNKHKPTIEAIHLFFN